MLRRTTICTAVLALLAVTACVTAGSGRTIPAGTTNPDQFLYERGKQALDKKKWLTAREFFKSLNETYTQSPLRPDAKLGIGDTYLGEGGGEALVFAINEYQEFLAFYPTHPRCDYAQYKLGMTHMRQMRAAQRDQTETRDAVKAFEEFVTRYPGSDLMPEVKAKLREAKDRLSEAETSIGKFYFKQSWYPGAISRLQSVIKDDPEFTGRDGAYFYLGESLLKANRPAEALPFYEKIVAEFEKSEYLKDANARIAALKTQIDARRPL